MSKNRLKYGFLILLAQTFVLICAAQQNLPSTSSGDIQFYLDDAAFLNFDKAGTSLRSFEGKTINLPGVSSGVPNGINVSTLTSGIYTLVIYLNLEAKELVLKSRGFKFT